MPNERDLNVIVHWFLFGFDEYDRMFYDLAAPIKTFELNYNL